MIYDIQTASVWKRMSAWLLDFIVILILATGFAVVTSLITNYGKYNNQLKDYYAQYEEEYDAKINITKDEYDKLDETEKKKYDDMFEALNNDKDVLYVYNLTINLMIVIVSVSLLLSVIISEFVVPLLFKNGQTIGKKIFGIGIVKNNDPIKVSKIQLFTRAIVGKYAIELMIPVLALIFILVGNGGLFSTLLIIGLALFQIGLCLFTRNHQAIHDVLAYTVVVDIQTQMIFNNADELLEYKKKNHSIEANKI